MNYLPLDAGKGNRGGEGLRKVGTPVEKGGNCNSLAADSKGDTGWRIYPENS